MRERERKRHKDIGEKQNVKGHRLAFVCVCLLFYFGRRRWPRG